MDVITRIGETTSDRAQTKPPARASTMLTPTVRRKVVLPAMLEPETMWMPPARSKSLHTRAPFGRSG